MLIPSLCRPSGCGPKPATTGPATGRRNRPARGGSGFKAVRTGARGGSATVRGAGFSAAAGRDAGAEADFEAGAEAGARRGLSAPASDSTAPEPPGGGALARATGDGLGTGGVPAPSEGRDGFFRGFSGPVVAATLVSGALSGGGSAGPGMRSVVPG